MGGLLTWEVREELGFWSTNVMPYNIYILGYDEREQLDLTLCSQNVYCQNINRKVDLFFTHVFISPSQIWVHRACSNEIHTISA